MTTTLDSFGARRTLTCNGEDYTYWALDALNDSGVGDISRMPHSLKVLIENLLRREDGDTVTAELIKSAVGWMQNQHADLDVTLQPARILLQDFTGVPAVVDLAAMRDAVQALGGDPLHVNPRVPVDLVIDHSVMIDQFASPGALQANIKREFERNRERYEFLRWGAHAFHDFRVIPPGTGICHQVNLEYLAQTVFVHDSANGKQIYPDTVLGTDSHTTMVNALAVLGFGVGGIEAEAAMLGQPYSMLLPDVVGFELRGSLPQGTTATDLVLVITQILRNHGVVGKFVEFFGDGLDALGLPDRATIANMAPEYGATCGFFPTDEITCEYLKFTGRDAPHVELVERYCRTQGLWRDADTPTPLFSETLGLDLADVVPSLAGPKRPQDRVGLGGVAPATAETIARARGSESSDHAGPPAVAPSDRNTERESFEVRDGDVVVAAITSCTNTSNPQVLIAAGLLARAARERGLKVPPWVKTSFAPGSQVVREYMTTSGLQDDLDALGFNIVAFGCTTCIGNSGPLPERVAAAIDEGDLVVGAVLSGNRNFEGRIHPLVQANFLASPPLVVAYALAGTLNIDLSKDPLGVDADGKPVMLADIWPDTKAIRALQSEHVVSKMFRERYAEVDTGPPEWQAMSLPKADTYAWGESSTYVRFPRFLDDLPADPPALADLHGARALLILGDSVTTDHISPAGNIAARSPAGEWLRERQVSEREFNSYGARRGNHEVMVRGTFANIRIRNEMMDKIEGGVTRHQPSCEQMSVFDAARRYADEQIPLIVIAGREYGTGSSRDWAAKGTALLGVRVVIAESFERIHRSNLIGMGVLPLEFTNGDTRKSLALNGSETFDIEGMTELEPGAQVSCVVRREDGQAQKLTLHCRIDTGNEMTYFRHGGILNYMVRRICEE